MSDTNRVSLGWVEEDIASSCANYGVYPTAPDVQNLRITGTPGLGGNPVTVVSNEIRSDRQITDLVYVGQEAAGDVGIELSYLAVGDLWQGVQCSTWVDQHKRENSAGATEINDVDNASATYDVDDTADTFVVGSLFVAEGFTNSGNNVIDQCAAGTNATSIIAENATLTDEAAPPTTAKIHCCGFEFSATDLAAAGTAKTVTSAADISNFATELGLTVGQWVKFGGADAGEQWAITAANNGWCRISAIAAAVITFDIVPSGWGDDAGTGKTIRMFYGDYMVNGVTERSYSLERQFTDQATPSYEYLTGMGINSFAINLAPQSIVDTTMNFMGKYSSFTTARVTNTTDYDSPTDDVLNTSSEIAWFGTGGSEVACPDFIMDATIEFNNSLRRKLAVGQLGAIGLGWGEFSVTGTLNTYFESLTEVNKLLNNTETSFTTIFKDASDHIMLVDLPSIKYTSGIPDVPGKNDEVMIPLAYQAYRNSDLTDTAYTGGYTAMVQRFWGYEE